MSNDEVDLDLDAYMGSLSAPDSTYPSVTTLSDSSSTKSDSSKVITVEPWVPEDEFSAMVEERSLHSGESNVQVIQRTIEENATVAVRAIAFLAMNSRSESVRLRAATYLVDKALEGKNGGQSLLEAFLNQIEDTANGGVKNAS